MSNNAFGGISTGYDSNNVFKYRDDRMCSKWSKIYKKFPNCNIMLMKNPYGNYVINGRLNGNLSNLAKTERLVVKYWAANKPTYSNSFSGSGLPYPNEKIAFENTDNTGIVEVKNGAFSINIHYPNSYYTNLGKKYIPPQLKIKFCNKENIAVTNVQKINLGQGVPFRSLTWPNLRNWNTGPMFYCNKNLPVRTQAQILKSYAYPSTNKEPLNFWGQDPPH